jgi:nucleotidyltransferase substrate binding protein (TIGR01987 family)
VSEVSYKALGDALERLQEALVLLEAHRDDDLHVSMRNSVLLSFQFTYALCRPMIKRFLVSEGDDPLEIQEMSYAALVRQANERGVLRADWTAWSGFRDARNRMARVYSEPVAEEIVTKVPGFLEEARYLYQQLVARSVEPGRTEPGNKA